MESAAANFQQRLVDIYHQQKQLIEIQNKLHEEEKKQQELEARAAEKFNQLRTEKDKEIESLSKELHMTQLKLSQIEEESRRKADLIHQLQEQIASWKRKQTEWDSQRTVLASRARELELKLTHEKDALQQKLLACTEENKSLHSRIEALERHRQQLTEAIDEYTSREENLRRDLQERMKEKEILVQKLDEMEKEIHTTKSASTKSQYELSQLKSLQVELERKLVAQQQKCIDLQRDLGNERSQVNELKHSIEALRKERDSLIGELQKANATLTKQASQIDSATDRIRRQKQKCLQEVFDVMDNQCARFEKVNEGIQLIVSKIQQRHASMSKVIFLLN